MDPVKTFREKVRPWWRGDVNVLSNAADREEAEGGDARVLLKSGGEMLAEVYGSCQESQATIAVGYEGGSRWY